jgi:hypothetical protein
MPANNDSYVPLQRLYNSSKSVLQLIVREGDPDFASTDSNVPIGESRLVSLFPGKTLRIEPNRVDQAQLEQYQGRISIQIGRGISIGVNPNPTPTSYVFDGTFYLECPFPTDLPTDNQERSMFGWARPATVPRSHQALFGYGPADTNLPYSHNVMVYNWEDRRDVEFWGSSTYYQSPSQNVLIPDEWNFVGMSWNGSKLTMYVNKFSWSIPASQLNTEIGVFRVGFAMAGSSELFIGSIKSVSVWNEARDYNFVEKLRNAGPVELNQLPSGLIKDEILSDCITSQNLYTITDLSVKKPPGNATPMEASTGAEYSTGTLQTSHSDYGIEHILVSDGEVNSGITVSSKDYALTTILTSTGDTIDESNLFPAGEPGPYFRASTKVLTQTLLESRTRTQLPAQNIEVYHGGALGSLTSRSVSNVPVFNLSARIKDDPELSQLRTSDNSVLQFGTSTYNGLVSYWNLTTIGNTNSDSVSNNDLLKIAV